MVAPETVRAHLKSMAERLDDEKKTGTKVGGVAKLAKLIGEHSASVGATIRGDQAPSKKVLAHLGLKKPEGYVKSQGKKLM